MGKINSQLWLPLINQTLLHPRSKTVLILDPSTSLRVSDLLILNLSTFFSSKKLCWFYGLNSTLFTLGHTFFNNTFAIGLTYLTTCGKMPTDMSFGFKSAGWRKKKTSNKSISDYKMEILVKQGRDQFKKLIAKGINIPVALLWFDTNHHELCWDLLKVIREYSHVTPTLKLDSNMRIIANIENSKQNSHTFVCK